MKCRPFESAASELVNEAAHPVEQLEVLEEKATDLAALGDTDAVIECRIKQLALNRLLLYLYDFPIQQLIRSEVTLAEAYATGSYFKQAHEHLAKAHEISDGGLFDDAQCQRLQVDMLLAEGVVQLLEEQPEVSHATLTEAARLSREAYGEMDVRSARIHSLLGQIAQQGGHYDEAVDHFSAAWEVREYVHGPEAEETIRLRLQIAEVEYLDGLADDALSTQQKVVKELQRSGAFPVLLVDASAQLARWFEAKGQDMDALEVLQAAEGIVSENLGAEDAKTVQIKRDVALLYLKIGDHETALRYLNDVHYFERRLHGSQSASVARTLKALGTVHLVRRNVADAEQCLCQALRIFEADYPPNMAIIKDIHAKLASISQMSRQPGAS